MSYFTLSITAPYISSGCSERNDPLGVDTLSESSFVGPYASERSLSLSASPSLSSSTSSLIFYKPPKSSLSIGPRSFSFQSTSVLKLSLCFSWVAFYLYFSLSASCFFLASSSFLAAGPAYSYFFVSSVTFWLLCTVSTRLSNMAPCVFAYVSYFSRLACFILSSSVCFTALSSGLSNSTLFFVGAGAG